ncbi:hypothetical protein ABMA27_016137 [Loxostege sticticalis]|uniref:HAT C-terminal dimerisation domain-containing protein n=1 Tax=Loxostege sticticalis TaxID=481309 RepID=A0ABR3I5T9_LOXSC
MNIPQKKKTYLQKYRVEWEQEEEFKMWLKPVLTDQSKAFCMYCHSEMFAKLADIRKHSSTKKHQNKCEMITKNRQISFTPVQHTAISQIDHLTELCKDVFSDSKSADLKLHRTKCTQIINQVLAPHFRENLVEDIGNQKYSLILDESTDVSVTKFMGIIVRYFSEAQSTVVSAFLSLEPVDRADANGLVTSLVNCIRSHNLPLQNLVGIGTDNAAVMTGRYNSVYEILKRQHSLPNLILIRCVCHSLQLAVSNASRNTIPQHIEFMIRETYKWSSISSKRKIEYKELYSLINCGNEPLKILKVCDTRWLSIEPAVVRILSQWEELKLHFSLTKDKCHTADLLSEMYRDEGNRLILLYLKSILNDVQTGIKVFEGENTDPVKLLTSLMNLLRSVCNRILMPSSATTENDYLTIQIDNHLSPVPHLGYLFETHVAKANLPRETVAKIRKSCIDFTAHLAKEIQNRLPRNYMTLQKMSQLSTENTLKQIKDDSITELAVEFGFVEDKIDKILRQWHSINYVKWDIPADTIKFWAQVLKYKDAAGANTFKDLADLAIAVLSLPHSNAEVERMFSSMNIVKNKLRNRLASTTLNSILLVRNQLKIVKQNCHNYVLPDHVLQKMTKTTTLATPSTSSTIPVEASTSSVSVSAQLEDEDDEVLLYI